MSKLVQYSYVGFGMYLECGTQLKNLFSSFSAPLFRHQHHKNQKRQDCFNHCQRNGWLKVVRAARQPKKYSHDLFTMISSQEDIASKLLHSSDARIAEAAKRVFSLSSTHTAAALSSFSEATKEVSSTKKSDKKHPVDAAIGTPKGGGETCTSRSKGAGEAKHTANNITSGPIEANTTTDEVLDENQTADKKPSSTERLQRR